MKHSIACTLDVQRKTIILKQEKYVSVLQLVKCFSSCHKITKLNKNICNKLLFYCFHFEKSKETCLICH